MAWPPPVLPTNRSNATPQQDTHPTDHNALALAINDTVARVQATMPTIAYQIVGGDNDVGGGTTAAIAGVTVGGRVGSYLVTATVGLTQVGGGVTDYNMGVQLDGAAVRHLNGTLSATHQIVSINEIIQVGDAGNHAIFIVVNPIQATLRVRAWSRIVTTFVGPA